MPFMRQFLKSLHSYPEIKSRFKTLIQESSGSLLYTKPSPTHSFAAGDLPSGSFRSFQFEFSRFSSRTLEVGDAGKPLSVSEAASRVFAIPSVHGPVWQSFGYHTYQALLDENPTVRPRQYVQLSTDASLQYRITRSRHPKLEAKFHVSAVDITSESFLCAEAIFPKPWGNLKNNPSWEEEMQIFDIRTCKQLEVAYIPKLNWTCDFEEAGQGQDTRECKVLLPNFQRSSAGFHFPCAGTCLPAIRDLFWNVVYGATHGVGAVKQPGLMLDSSLEDMHFIVEEIASARSLTSKGLRLLSGACYFPHPNKEATGGEDAYFICPDKQVIGVADGVGGWADIGVDAGEYARQLMSESLIAAREEPTGRVDAARVLEKAHSKTTCQGSSTACILALSDYGLQAVNLGDSGFLVVRNGQMIFKSPAQQHTFNFPFQLESCGGDPVSAAEIFVVEVAVGDVIIAGTDGLFDNLYATEMASVVVQATWSGMSPDVMAQTIAYTARDRARDRNRQTPFSAAAQDAGFRFYGGKMDDITVIVSSLTSKGLRLLSGACYFPHPNKEATGGEDAYFICPDKQVIGVADGVGGWADIGVDAGEYARQLMSESLIAAREEPTGRVDAARVLEKAHSKTTCQGSSTACILALSDYGLQAVNLGDSGFLVVRNGQMIFKSPAQQHTFNFPFQLESCGGDPVSAAEIFVVEVAVGDVIIAGTDGLFDNLYATEMASVVVQATWSGMSPDVMAQTIAYTARDRARDRNRQTPFSAAAQDAGFRFYGGKMDDITVIVSYVTDCNVFKGGFNHL